MTPSHPPDLLPVWRLSQELVDVMDIASLPRPSEAAHSRHAFFMEVEEIQQARAAKFLHVHRPTLPSYGVFIGHLQGTSAAQMRAIKLSVFSLSFFPLTNGVDRA